MKVQRQDVLQQNFMKIEFFVLSTRHQNCLDKSLEQNIWFIVYASFSPGGLNLLADLRGDLARKKRGGNWYSNAHYGIVNSLKIQNSFQ